MDTYKPLEDYLKGEVRTTILTYAEIEHIIGTKLPMTAYARKQWWVNNPDHHSQAKAWLNAGWKVKDVKLGEYVTFIRE